MTQPLGRGRPEGKRNGRRQRERERGGEEKGSSGEKEEKREKGEGEEKRWQARVDISPVHPQSSHNLSLSLSSLLRALSLSFHR
jgi:hypothetical protein